jgi:SAM-dependent methyltransferase
VNLYNIISRLFVRVYLASFTLPALRRLRRRPFRLPFEPFGYHEIERIIEIPWAISRCYRADRLLDIGFARAERKWISTLVRLPVRELHGIDLLSPEHYRCPALMRRLYAIEGDILRPPYCQDTFDCILCISTMEHFGMLSHIVRNPYGAPPWHQDRVWFDDHRADFDAIRTLYHITAPGGRLLLTLPYGQLASYGSHIQYDADRIQRLIEYSGYQPVSAEYYRYRYDGYYETDADSLADVLFQQDGAPGATGLICLELHK